MHAYRVRVMPEVGYYELCGLLVLGPPVGGRCPIYRHPRRDLTREKAEELAAKILEAGQFNPANWLYLHDIEALRVL